MIQKLKSLNAKGLDVLSKNHRPEIDISEELGAQEASYFQYLIVILRWMVELGRLDIYTETSMMSSHISFPRRRNLESLFHMFTYLKKHQNSDMLFDVTNPNVNMDDFQLEDFGLSIYDNDKEDMPPIVSFSESGTVDMYNSRGQVFIMIVYFVCDLSVDYVTHIPRTGFAIFLN